MKKIGILIQIGNYNIWTKIKDLILNFKGKDIIVFTHFNNDLIKIAEKKIIIDFYKSLNINCHVTNHKNNGMDICGFFNQIEYIIKHQIHVDLILKIHTKSNNKWRSSLIDPICGSSEIIDKCIKLFEDDNVGQISSELWLKLMDHFNTPIILEELERMKIENNFIDEINWKKKYENIYDLEFFDPVFYLKYPYNNIYYEKKLEYDIERFKSYSLFHWLQIGHDKFKFVQNEELIIKKTKHIKFSAGSIFWMRADILIEFFKKNISFKSYYDRFEHGYFNNEKPTLTHTWERFFSIITEISNKKNIGV